MTNDEKFAADLSAITGKRIDVPKAEADIDAIDAADPITAEMTRLNAVFQARFAAQAKAREEQHLQDSIRALERLLFAHGDEAHTRGHRYDRARRALVEAIDEWNRLQPLLALPRLEDGPVNDIDTMQAFQAGERERVWYNQYVTEVSDFLGYAIKSGSTEDEIAYDQYGADVSAEETAAIIREILRDGAS
jgi:hypothetical protein